MIKEQRYQQIYRHKGISLYLILEINKVKEVIMNTTENKTQIIEFSTKGTCSKAIQVEVMDDKIVNAKFFGGCQGNLEGIQNLIKGMSIIDVIEKLQGVKCGAKSTSCPDQLAKCLLEYNSKYSQTLAK